MNFSHDMLLSVAKSIVSAEHDNDGSQWSRLTAPVRQGYIDVASAALTAALPFLPVQVTVKKLEWEKHIEKEEWYGGSQNELVGVNEYDIFAHPCATGLFVLDVMGNRCDDDFTSVEAAKAAAQADYEARIKSAIVGGGE